MKKIPLIVLLAAAFSGCTSKPIATTKEHRGNPANAIAYGGFIDQRTEQLQQMGGPFKDRAAARQKAEEEANTHFGGPAGDSVTTTWSSSKAQAQEEFTDKLDDMAKQKKEP
jgi:hypothetical protein